MESITGIRPGIGRPVGGTTTNEIVRYFVRKKYKVTVGQNWGLEELRYYTSLGQPVICLITADNMGHWVVVWKVNSRGLHYHCPTKGPQVTPGSKWLDLWKRPGYSGHGITVATSSR